MNRVGVSGIDVHKRAYSCSDKINLEIFQNQI